MKELRGSNENRMIIMEKTMEDDELDVIFVFKESGRREC